MRINKQTWMWAHSCENMMTNLWWGWLEIANVDVHSRAIQAGFCFCIQLRLLPPRLLLVLALPLPLLSSMSVWWAYCLRFSFILDLFTGIMIFEIFTILIKPNQNSTNPNSYRHCLMRKFFITDTCTNHGSQSNRHRVPAMCTFSPMLAYCQHTTVYIL